jgi:hypothetical protein
VAKGAFCGVECIIIPSLHLWCSNTIAVPVSTNPDAAPPMIKIARGASPDYLMKAVAVGSHGWIGDSLGVLQLGIVARQVLPTLQAIKLQLPFYQCRDISLNGLETSPFQDWIYLRVKKVCNLTRLFFLKP